MFNSKRNALKNSTQPITTAKDSVFQQSYLEFYLYPKIAF